MNSSSHDVTQLTVNQAIHDAPYYAIIATISSAITTLAALIFISISLFLRRPCIYTFRHILSLLKCRCIALNDLTESLFESVTDLKTLASTGCVINDNIILVPHLLKPPSNKDSMMEMLSQPNDGKDLIINNYDDVIKNVNLYGFVLLKTRTSIILFNNSKKFVYNYKHFYRIVRNELSTNKHSWIAWASSLLFGQNKVILVDTSQDKAFMCTIEFLNLQNMLHISIYENVIYMNNSKRASQLYAITKDRFSGHHQFEIIIAQDYIMKYYAMHKDWFYNMISIFVEESMRDFPLISRLSCVSLNKLNPNVEKNQLKSKIDEDVNSKLVMGTNVSPGESAISRHHFKFGGDIFDQKLKNDHYQFEDIDEEAFNRMTLSELLLLDDSHHNKQLFGRDKPPPKDSPETSMCNDDCDVDDENKKSVHPLISEDLVDMSITSNSIVPPGTFEEYLKLNNNNYDDKNAIVENKVSSDVATLNSSDIDMSTQHKSTEPDNISILNFPDKSIRKESNFSTDMAEEELKYIDKSKDKIMLKFQDIVVKDGTLDPDNYDRLKRAVNSLLEFVRERKLEYAFLVKMHFFEFESLGSQNTKFTDEFRLSDEQREEIISKIFREKFRLPNPMMIRTNSFTTFMDASNLVDMIFIPNRHCFIRVLINSGISKYQVYNAMYQTFGLNHLYMILSIGIITYVEFLNLLETINRIDNEFIPFVKIFDNLSNWNTNPEYLKAVITSIDDLKGRKIGNKNVSVIYIIYKSDIAYLNMDKSFNIKEFTNVDHIYLCNIH